MVLFIGQVARGARDREGFQEVNFRAMFAPLAKWTADIDRTERIPEYVARAFRTAISGRAGPVVLTLPEDVLYELVNVAPLAEAAVSPAVGPRATDLEMFRAMLASASRPLLVIGGSGWTSQGCMGVAQFVERNALPIVASFRRQDLLDNRHANYCGHLGLGVDPKLAERVKAADLIVAIGSRLGENTTSGYSLLEVPVPRQALIHIHPDANELGRVYQPTLAINCSLAEFGYALTNISLPDNPRRGEWLREARQDYLRFSTAASAQQGYVDLAAVMAWLSEHLADDAIICNGAGNYTVWVHRYFRYKQLRTELAPTSGAMGYGLPAAIAAKLRHPDRQVIGFAGDGCFLMYPQELGTAVQYRANVLLIIVNNGTYGTIRMHQEMRYPGRVLATDILNPDFVGLAQSYGAYAARVDSTAGFTEAFQQAAAAERPAILDLRVDPAQLTPNMRLQGRKSAKRP